MFLFKNYSRHADVAHFLLRLAVAAAFLNHGLQKWALWQQVPPEMPGNMLMLMRMLSVAEPLAALSLILGLLMRLANIGLMLVMISALYLKLSSGLPMNVWEIDMLLLTANIVLFIEGAGRYSLDAKLKKS